MSVKDWHGNISEQMGCILYAHSEGYMKEEINELTEKEAKEILFRTTEYANQLQKESDKYQEVKGALYWLSKHVSD